MPSTTSNSLSRLLASSTVITPSLPTLAMASARKRPISLSPLALMVPIWAISSLLPIFLAWLLRSSTTAVTARSMPRFRSIGFMPAATDLAPSLTMAWASTVAVVVPSPARSLVLLATSRTICAPIFSNLSSSSISLATVTPSLVMRGAPNDFSITTLRPLGPSVTLTAFASVSTPRSIFSRASDENLTSLAAMAVTSFLSDVDDGWMISSGRLLDRPDLLDDAKDVALLHDEQFLAVDLDLGAGPFAEEDMVTGFHIEGDEFALLVAGTGTGGNNLAFLRLFLCGVGNDDAPGGVLRGINSTHDDTVVQRAEMHANPPCSDQRCHKAQAGVAGRRGNRARIGKNRVQEVGAKFFGSLDASAPGS